MDSKKLLPQSGQTNKGGAIVLAKDALVPGVKVSKIRPRKKVLKEAPEATTAKRRLFDINKIFGSNLFSSRKRYKNRVKSIQKQRKEEKESTLEKRQVNPKTTKVPKPELPKTGLLDGVKNYISNVLMGILFTNLEKITPIIENVWNGIKPIVGFIEKIGGGILNGLITLVNEGYKAYDQTRKWIGEKWGTKGTENFDKFTKQFDIFLTSAVAVAIALAKKGKELPTPPPPCPTPSGRNASFINPQRYRIPGQAASGGTFQENLSRQALTKERMMRYEGPKGPIDYTRRMIRGVGAQFETSPAGRLVGRISQKVPKFPTTTAWFRWAGRILRIIGLGFLAAEIKNDLDRGDTKAVAVKLTAYGLGWMVSGLLYAKGASLSATGAGAAAGVPLIAAAAPAGAAVDYGFRKAFGYAQGGQITRNGVPIGGPITRSLSKPISSSKRTYANPQKSFPGQTVGGKKKIDDFYGKKAIKVLDEATKIRNVGTLDGIFGSVMGAPVDAILGQKTNEQVVRSVGNTFGAYVESLVNTEIDNANRTGTMKSNLGKKIGQSISQSLSSSMNNYINDIIDELKKQMKVMKTPGPGPGPGEEEIPTPGARLRGGSNAQIEADLLEYFTALYGKTAAIGIVANLQRESGYRTKTPDNSRYEGMAQWSRDDRWPKFVKWAEKNKLDPYSRNAQAQYVAIELKQLGTDKRISQAKTPEEAASIFYNEFERGAYSKPVKGKSYNPDNPHENKNRGFVRDLTKRNPEIGKRSGEVLAPISFDATLKAETFKPISGTSGKDQGNVALSVPYSPFTSSAGNPTITSGKGFRWGREHKGLDIGAAEGTPMFAYLPGVIVSSGWDSGGYGYRVAWKDANGNIHSYSHMQSDPGFRVGQQVTQGQLMGKVGSTGRSTAPHLHWEIVSGGTYQDPVKWTQRNPLPSPIQLAMKDGKQGVIKNGQWMEQSWTDEQIKRYQQQQARENKPVLNKGVYYDPNKKKFFKKTGIPGFDQEIDPNQGSNIQFRSLPSFLGRGTSKNQIKTGPDGRMYIWDGTNWQIFRNPDATSGQNASLLSPSSINAQIAFAPLPKEVLSIQESTRIEKEIVVVRSTTIIDKTA